MKQTKVQSGFLGRRLAAGLGWCAVSVAVGCGGAPEMLEGTEGETGARGDAFVSKSSGGLEFKYITPITQLPNQWSDAGFCTPNSAHSKVIFQTNNTDGLWGASDVVGIIGPWGKYGPSTNFRKFSSRPACAFLLGASSPYPFIVLARGAKAPDGTTDRRLMWSKGEWTFSETAPAPTALTPWAALDSTQYSFHGTPAVASTHTALVVVYLDQSGQIKANYWTGSTFSPTITGPALPAGWTGTGTPAIAWVPTWGRFIIVVRAKDSASNYRFYHTAFFSSSFLGGPSAYTQLTLPASAPPIQGDPAYEYDSHSAAGYATLYYRSSNKIYQGSADANNFSSSTFKAVTDGGSPSPFISGDPVAIGGVPYEAGRHWLLVRGTGGMLFAESFNDELLKKN